MAFGKHGLPVGVVLGITGPLWMKFTLHGQAGHAGATPMVARKNPLPAAAARLIIYIHELSGRQFHTVATVGRIHTVPGGINIIPSQAEFTLDLRDIDEAVRDWLERRIINKARKICAQYDINLGMQVLQSTAPALCSTEIIQAIKSACAGAGIRAERLISGAEHDGMQLKGIFSLA